jgi:hypothetical protein
VANRADTSTCSAARKLMVRWSVRARAGQEDDVAATEKVRSAGSADTEITEVAVKPTGRSSSRRATTATPAGC